MAATEHWFLGLLHLAVLKRPVGMDSDLRLDRAQLSEEVSHIVDHTCDVLKFLYIVQPLVIAMCWCHWEDNLLCLAHSSPMLCSPSLAFSLSAKAPSHWLL